MTHTIAQESISNLRDYITQSSTEIANLKTSLANLQADCDQQIADLSTTIASQITNAVAGCQVDLESMRISLQGAEEREQTALAEIARLNAAIDAAQNP